MSHRIRRLEESLGVRLFERQGRGVRPSADADRIIGDCIELTTLARRLRETALGRGGRFEGRVVLGTHPTLASQLLAPAICDLLEQHPRVQPVLIVGDEQELLGRLRSGALDLAVLIGPTDLTGVDVVPIRRDHFVAVMAPALAPRRRGIVRPAELRGMRCLAWHGPPDSTFALVQAFAKRHRLLDETTPYVPHIDTLKKLAAGGAGYALMPRYAAAHEVEAGVLVALKLAGLSHELPIVLVRRPGRTPAGPVQALVHAISALSK